MLYFDQEPRAGLPPSKSECPWPVDFVADTLQGEIIKQALSAAQNAKDAADDACKKAEAASASVEQAKTAAQSAQTVAESANTLAQSAKAAVETARDEAEAASTSAQSAKTAAETARDEAKAVSTSAQSAKTAAETARDEAKAASASAQSAKTAAETARDEAKAVSTSAQSAKTAAETAQGKAEAANTSAQSAKAAVETARDEAKAASALAQSAKTAAETARGEAKAASASAQSAKTAAETAQGKAEAASASVQSAKTAAETAQGKAEAASTSAQSAKTAALDSSKLSKSWAVGGTGTRTGEDTNNARYWSEQAQNAAGGGVSSFNGRSGAVAPQKGDYTAAMVGADEQGAAQTVQDNLNTHAQNTTAHISATERTSWNAKANAADLTSHVDDEVKHITAAERTAWNGKQNALTFDTTPTEGSTNPVTSGGVKAALDDLLPQPIITVLPPTTSTVGVVGQEYINLMTMRTWRCMGASGGEYDWMLCDAGVSTKFDVTLSASGWSTEKKYTVSNSNITATSAVELLPRENNGITQAQLEALSGAMIVGGTQAAGSIQLVALGDKPTTDIPVTLIIRRDL